MCSRRDFRVVYGDGDSYQHSIEPTKVPAMKNFSAHSMLAPMPDFRGEWEVVSRVRPPILDPMLSNSLCVNDTHVKPLECAKDQSGRGNMVPLKPTIFGTPRYGWLKRASGERA